MINISFDNPKMLLTLLLVPIYIYFYLSSNKNKVNKIKEFSAINFIEFYFTDTLKDIVKSSLEIKRYKKNTSLQDLYEKFNSQRINKIAIKEIKKAII